MSLGLDKRQQRRARRREALLAPPLLRLIYRQKYMTRTTAKELDAARERDARLIEQPCSEGNCIDLIDPETGENRGGFGPVGCPCQDES